MYKALDVLAKKVGVLGIFSDWLGTISYYANCMGPEISTRPDVLLLWDKCRRHFMPRNPKVIFLSGCESTLQPALPAFHLQRSAAPDRRTVRLQKIGRVLMNGRTTITLYDRDNGRTDWWDSDDLLGSRSVMRGNGVRTLTFNGDGAHYTLHYRIE